MAAATTTPNNNGSLTLSSATFAKLSPHPYLLANLQPPPSSSSSDSSTPSSSSSSSSSPPSARANGRQPRQARTPNVNTSSLSHAHGSAVVRTGDTTVICGVRGETLAASQIPNYRVGSAADISSGGSGGGGDGDGDTSTTRTMDELRDYDLLVPNIELATGCAPSFLPGAPPTALAQTLSTRVYSLLHDSGLLDVADLRIYQQDRDDNDDDDDELEEGEGQQQQQQQQQQQTTKQVKAYWVLYIDLLFISFDGNPFDAAWAAVVAALRDTKLPRAHWDPDREMVVCSRDAEARPLRARGLPVACTAAVFTATRDRQRRGRKGNNSGGGGGDAGGGQQQQQQYWILVDPDRFEESLCDESVTVVVDKSQGEGDTRILGISKSGGTVVGPQVLSRLVDVAEGRWLDFKKALA